jgi:hypothetical protein
MERSGIQSTPADQLPDKLGLHKRMSPFTPAAARYDTQRKEGPSRFEVIHVFGIHRVLLARC